MPEHPLLNFFDQLKIDNTYELFFPKKEQGLVIIWLNQKQDFSQRDIQRGRYSAGFSGNQFAEQGKN